MFRVVYNRKKSLDEVKEAYAKIIEKDIDKEWGNLVAKYPKMKKAIAGKMKASDLLTAEFEKLVDVYFRYISLKGELDKKEGPKMHAQAEKIFSYGSYKEKIAGFFMNDDYGFEVHNCYYCELEDVSKYKDSKGREKRQFQIEHVLDKGTCPMVGLSLFNFVPSCGHCNSQGVKGNNTIGDTKDEIKKLSPTIPTYNMENKVIFVVNYLNPLASDFDMANHPDDYEIGFYYLDKLYEKSVKLFDLSNRYNKKNKKTQLLKVLENRLKHPYDDLVKTLGSEKAADALMEDLLQLQASKENHWQMNKARWDIARNSFMPVIL